jgi:hypothetical protein
MSNEKNFAFPVTGMQVGVVKGGLTKRELIAAMCLQGLLSNASGVLEPRHWVDWAVIYADRLLEELSKERS